MEMIGGSGRENTTGTIHFANSNNNHQYIGGSTTLSGTLADSFHAYGIEWDSSSIRWFLDGVQFASGDHLSRIELNSVTTSLSCSM